MWESSSQDSSIGSALDWYHKGRGCKEWRSLQTNSQRKCTQIELTI